MVLHCISLLFKMLLPCIMAGFHFALLHTVLVEHFLLNMLNLVLKVVIRHYEIRDLTSTLLTEVCCQVATEPELQPVY